MPDELPDKETVGEEVATFVNQIDGLANVLPLTLQAIISAQVASVSELDRFFANECTPNPEKKNTFKIEVGKVSRYHFLRSHVQKTQLARELVPRSFLVALVSQFDAFVGRLVRQLFKIKPEILNSSENTLTYSQLTGFGSLGDAREFVIDKEVDGLLRKSHAEQFDWLEKKFGLPLRKDLEAWPTFIEVTERRNLFVHTNGRVSHQYLEVCRRHSCPIGEKIVSGKSLSVTRQYFRTAHECIFEIGVKLAQVLWRRIQPEEIAHADSNLITVGFELLTEGRNKLACVLLDFATETLRRHSSEEKRLTLVINRAQAYKWAGDEEKCKAILGAEDWSATSLQFRLCQSVLLDDFETACKLASDIGPTGSISKHAYRDWPVFRELRKSTDFCIVFEKIFGESLNTITVDPEQGQAAPSVN